MIYQVDPLGDMRWDELVRRHRNSSIFHTSGWLAALQRTYGYEPVVYTTCPPGGELTNGLVFCRLSSWLTGKRLVSLPFSDHCDPLLEDGNSGVPLFEELCREQASQHWRYIEIRPRSRFPSVRTSMGPRQTYCLHALDLSRTAEELFANFHTSCIKRKIQRAEREKLVYREGRSPDLLRMFYRLVLITRRRHQVPPQPFAWFWNLAEWLGSAMQVRLALVCETPVAGVVTLRFRNTTVLKYAASDARLHNLGGTQWLIWKASQEAKVLGSQELDLGRSGWDNPGLITFKDRLGGKRFSLSYWQCPKVSAQPRLQRAFRRPVGWILGHMPLSVVTLAGRSLYRHVG